MASDIPNEDLLLVATQGKVKGTQFEMGKSEMQKADGGYYYIKRIYGNPYHVYHPRYSSYWYEKRYFTISIRR